MKFATIAALATVASADAAADKQKENTMWYVDGVKGLHEGFYKSFYKSSSGSKNDECLNDETINNLITYGNIAADPLNIFSNIANIQADFNIFADGTEIYENFGKCRLEGPTFDIIELCAKDATACAPTQLLENLTKNMFVLVGKITSMAETFKGFPAVGRDDFKEQMSEVGDDFGTFLRVIFQYHN